MATIKTVSQFTVDLGGEFKSDGDLVTERDITAATGTFVDIKATVVNTSGDNFNLVTLWTVADGGLGDFDFLWFKADAECLLSLIHSYGSSPKHTTIKCLANQEIKLAADDAYQGALTDGYAEGLIDQIDQIKVKNDVTGASATITVNCRLVLVT
jgi:hypothetical protein